jgi:hypothetical protein
MNPWIIAAGAALGLLRAQQQERAAHEDRKVQGTKTRWATFTGAHGKDTPHTDTMGMVMQGAMAGALLGQQLGGKGDDGKTVTESPAGIGNTGTGGSQTPNFYTYGDGDEYLDDPVFGARKKRNSYLQM